MRFFISKRLPFGLRAGVSIPLNLVERRSPQRASAGQMTGAFIYVIRGDHNLVKIGVSTNPIARMAQLRTASGFPLAFSYICAVEGDAANAYAIEGTAHVALARHRTNGEWFDVAPEMAVAAIAAASHKTRWKIVEIPADKVAEVIRLASVDYHQAVSSMKNSASMPVLRLIFIAVFFCFFTFLSAGIMLFSLITVWPDAVNNLVWLKTSPLLGAYLTYWTVNFA